MVVKVVNHRGFTIMQVNDLKDMFTPEQIHQIAIQGYFFVVNNVFLFGNAVGNDIPVFTGHVNG